MARIAKKNNVLIPVGKKGTAKRYGFATPKGISKFPKELQKFFKFNKAYETGAVGIYISTMGFKELESALNDFQQNYLHNELPAGAMQAAVNGLGTALEKNFRTQGQSGGHPWPPLSPGTRAIRMRLGYPSDQELVRTGALMTAVSSFVTKYDKTHGMASTFKGTITPSGDIQRKYGIASSTVKRKDRKSTRLNSSH